MKKKAIIYCLACIMVLATTTQGLATTSNDVSNESGLITINEIVLENTQADGFIPGNNVTSVGSVSYHDALKVETGNKEITIKLFPTFDYPQQALNNIASDVSSILNEMRFTYNLPTFDANSWEMYYNKIPDYETIIAGNSIKESQTAKLSARIRPRRQKSHCGKTFRPLTLYLRRRRRRFQNSVAHGESRIAPLSDQEGQCAHLR